MNLPNFIKPPIWAAFRAISRLNLAVRKPQYRYVFILAHVRSGSSMLAHILASHPDLVGAGETHISYRTAADFQQLILKTCELLHRPALREAFIVDQINHPYVTNEILLSEKIHKCIILLRQPEATLKSMLSLEWREEEALDLYINRLKSLTQYGLLLRERALLVEYDDLVDHTEYMLASLTNHLQLASPLLSNYATHRMTGRIEGHGDPSINIKSGRVIRTPPHEIAVSKEALIVAQAAFSKYRGQLQIATTQARP